MLSESGAPSIQPLRKKRMRREESAHDQICTAFHVSAPILMQSVRDFWGSLSVSGVFAVYKKR
jgi:hypothetical protein